MQVGPCIEVICLLPYMLAKIMGLGFIAADLGVLV